MGANCNSGFLPAVTAATPSFRSILSRCTYRHPRPRPHPHPHPHPRPRPRPRPHPRLSFSPRVHPQQPRPTRASLFRLTTTASSYPLRSLPSGYPVPEFACSPPPDSAAYSDSILNPLATRCISR